MSKKSITKTNDTQAGRVLTLLGNLPSDDSRWRLIEKLVKADTDFEQAGVLFAALLGSPAMPERLAQGFIDEFYTAANSKNTSMGDLEVIALSFEKTCKALAGENLSESEK